MKKLLAFLFALVGIAGVASCDQIEIPTQQPTVPTEEPTEEVVLTDITLTVEKATVNVEYGSSYRVLDGVKAVGNDGVSYALKVTATCETAAITDGKLDTKVPGTHVINLVLDYQGIHKTATKTVIVGEKPDTSGNLLANPNFDADYTGWEKYQDGSTVSWETEEIDGVSYAKVVETSVSGNSYSPRLHNNGSNCVQFYAGTAYKVSFEAKASTNKKMACQVGQLIGGAPYFYDFAGQVFTFEIGTSMSVHSFTFVMGNPDPAADTSLGSLTLEMGTVNGDSTAATIWIGNIVIEEFSGEVADQLPPVISAVNKTIFIGDCETVDLNSFVSANDAKDGAVVPSYVIKNEAGETIDSISGEVAGVYTVEISAVDAAGNKAESTITVTVKARSGASNVFGTVDGVMKGEEKDAATNAGKFIYWTVDDAAWNIGPVTSTEVSLENGVLKFINNQGENPNAWGIQAFYGIPVIENAGEYVLSASIKSSVAGNITLKVNNVPHVVSLVAGENYVSVNLGDLAEGQSYTLVVLFGTQTDGEAPIGSGTFEFSNFKLAKVNNAFGTVDGVMKGEEKDAATNAGKFIYWTVDDAAWNIGPVTSTEVSLENGVLKFINNQGENPNAWGIQAFYGLPVVEISGNYVLSVKINSTVAGKLTFKVNNVAYEFDVVVGDNNISLNVGPLTEGTSSNFVILFGTQSAGEAPIGSGTFEFSNFKLIHQPNYFGEIEGVAKGGESDLAANEGKLLYWTVEDVKWNCGPVTSAEVSLENGVLKFINNQGENPNAWGIQAFYGIPALEEAGNYKLYASINSTVAGKLTFKVGAVVLEVEVAVGANNVELNVGSLAAGQGYNFVILFGTQTDGVETPIGSGTFEFSNIKLVK